MWNRVERCLPLHLNFSSFSASILLRCILLGVSHFAPDVSIGFLCRYSANHFRLQSQMKGFLARCLYGIRTIFVHDAAWIIRMKLLTEFGCFWGNRNCRLPEIVCCCRKVREDSGCGDLWRYLYERRRCRLRLEVCEIEVWKGILTAYSGNLQQLKRN